MLPLKNHFILDKFIFPHILPCEDNGTIFYKQKKMKCNYLSLNNTLWLMKAKDSHFLVSSFHLRIMYDTIIILTFLNYALWKMSRLAKLNVSFSCTYKQEFLKCNKYAYKRISILWYPSKSYFCLLGGYWVEW